MSKVPQISELIDKWREMQPLEHIAQARHVWIIGNIGTGKDYLKLRLDAKVADRTLKDGYPKIMVLGRTLGDETERVQNNDVVLQTKRTRTGLYARTCRVYVERGSQKRNLVWVGVISISEKK